MVPEGWVRSTLEGYVDIMHGFAFKSEFFASDGRYIVMTPGHFYESGGFRDQGAKTKYYVGPLPDGYVLRKGDVVLAMTEQASGLLGSAAYVPENDKYLHNQRLGLLTCKDAEKACIDFLYLIYNSPAARKQISEQASGTKVKHTSPDKLKGVAALMPPLCEQKKIAQILSTWDKAIATTEKLLANSQQQKKALMQQLLTGKRRLLDRKGTRFSSQWTYLSIKDVASRIQRKSDAGAHPILTISSQAGFVRQDKRYSRYMAGESVKNYILLKKGEFAYNKGNSKTYQFGCIFDLEEFESGLVPHVYVCFTLKAGMNRRYFKYLFEADYLKPQLGRLVNTGVRNNGLLNIKPSQFMATRVPVPCLEEQERVADVLETASLECRQLEDNLERLVKEKQALMQQLLTGRCRVGIVEPEAA